MGVFLIWLSPTISRSLANLCCAAKDDRQRKKARPLLSSLDAETRCWPAAVGHGRKGWACLASALWPDGRRILHVLCNTVCSSAQSAHMSNCPSAQGRGMMIRETSVPGLSPVLNPYTSRTAHRLCCSTQVPCDNIENGPTVHFALSATEAACIRRGRRQHPSSLSKPTTSSSSAKQSSAPAASVSGFPSRRPLIHKGNSRFLLQFRRLCAPPHRETARVIPVIISHATSCGLSVDEKATVHSRVHAYIQTS